MAPLVLRLQRIGDSDDGLIRRNVIYCNVIYCNVTQCNAASLSSRHVRCLTVGYTMDVLYFAWLNNPCEIDKDVDFPQFEHIGTLLYDCSKNYTAGWRRGIFVAVFRFQSIKIIL
jgi:hypothetical protein